MARGRTRLGTARHAVERASPPPPGAYASFGTNTWVVPPARIDNPQFISVGNDVILHEHVWLSAEARPGFPPPQLSIGNRCNVGHGLHIVCQERVILEDEILAAAEVIIFDTLPAHEDPSRPIMDQGSAAPRPVHIGKAVFLGFGCTILPGVSIGHQAYIAAGAVVHRDVEPLTIMVGNPARAVRKYDAHAEDWVSA
jgi:acetyltransferase-like isoleucine patch superfamily enzyme